VLGLCFFVHVNPSRPEAAARTQGVHARGWKAADGKGAYIIRVRIVVILILVLLTMLYNVTPSGLDI